MRIIFIACFFSILSCAHESASNLWTIAVHDTQHFKQLPPNLERSSGKLASSLRQYMADHPQRKSEISAYLAAVDAKAAEEDGRIDVAGKLWRDSLKSAQGRLGSYVTQNWIRTELSSLKRPQPEIAVKMLLAQIDYGAKAPYLKKIGLDEEGTFVVYLKKNFASLLEGTFSNSEQSAILPEPPANGKVPEADPLLDKSAQIFCKNLDDDAWKRWKSNLQDQVGIYFKLLIERCTRNGRENLDDLEKSISQLSSSRQNAALAIASMRRLIAARRAVGERENLPPFYLDLMLLWTKYPVKANELGESEQNYYLNRANDAIWSARYRAVVRDNENARIFVQMTLDLLNDALLQIKSIDSEFKRKVADLRVESFHFLAHRLALEEQDFARCLTLTSMALQTPDISKEWRERLLWHHGLYEYLSGNLDRARQQWDMMLAGDIDQSTRPMLLFWLARVTFENERKDEAQFYLADLRKNFPLSFYSIVAVREYFGDGKQKIDFTADSAENDRSKFDEVQNTLFDDATLKAHAYAVDALLATQNLQLAEMALLDLEDDLRRKGILENSTASLTLLARLQSKAYLLQKSTAATQRASLQMPGYWHAFPKQIAFFFPSPYEASYSEAERMTGMDARLLQAISRQESSFEWDIKSGAGAYGVMQVLPQVARQFDENFSQKIQRDKNILSKPAYTISIAAKLLKQISVACKQQIPCIAAAYNAGLVVVDGWMERRFFKDMILFIELMPYQETKLYTKNVWRNYEVYRFLTSK